VRGTKSYCLSDLGVHFTSPQRPLNGDERRGVGRWFRRRTRFRAALTGLRPRRKDGLSYWGCPRRVITNKPTRSRPELRQIRFAGGHPAGIRPPRDNRSRKCSRRRADESPPRADQSGFQAPSGKPMSVSLLSATQSNSGPRSK